MQKVGKAVTRSVKEDGEKTRKEAVERLSASVQQPVLESFEKTMAKVIVPAYQAGAAEMMSQLNAHVSKGMEKVRQEAGKRESGLATKLDEVVKANKQTEAALRKENEDMKKVRGGLRSANRLVRCR